MDERESDLFLGYGSEPNDVFRSEREVPLCNADAPETRIVLRDQTALVILSSDDSAASLFPSERDVPGCHGGSLSDIVPTDSVRDGSLTYSVAGPAPEARAATNVEWGSPLPEAGYTGPQHISRRAVVRQQMITATIAAWREVTSINRVPLGLAVAALGAAAIYATVPSQLAGARHGTAAPIVAEPLFSREAAAAAAQDGTSALGSTSDPSRRDADSRDAAALARPNPEPSPRLLANEVDSRPERLTTAEERRAAVTVSMAEKQGERPQEALVTQLPGAHDASVVAGTLPALAAPAEPADEGLRSTDVVSTSTTSELQGAELVAVRTGNERVDELPLMLPTAGDAGRLVPAAPSTNSVVVQAILARYANAYERLDAGSVKEIWPTVDERALARAFGDLQAQSITFEACDLTIGDTRATASCRGSATYVTGVGKRSNVTQKRQWTFLLERSPERWAIQEIQVR